MENESRKFKTEQEEREDELMAFIRQIGTALEEMDKLPQRTVEHKVRLVGALARELEKYYGDQAKVEYMLHQPCKNSAIIEMRCKEFCVKDAGQFVALISLGDDIDIHPYTDGTLSINIGIDGLTEFINEEERK